MPKVLSAECFSKLEDIQLLLDEMENTETQETVSAKTSPEKSSLVGKVRRILAGIQNSSKALWVIATQKEDPSLELSQGTKKRSIWIELPLLFRSLIAKDKPTRRGAWLLIFSLISLGIILKMLVTRTLQTRMRTSLQRAKVQAQLKLQEEAKNSETDQRRARTIALGSFTLELKPLKDSTDVHKGFNLAEMDLVAYCDTEATQHYLQKHLVLIRNEITTQMESVEREELMTAEGKRNLKKLLTKKLNDILPSGKIIELYISRFVLD